ncbi:hypothetical protein NUW54_g12670 [Trametes sanguinea]|uniref:Uncharacterized protein n=1 Tax=Trametes sanguinea TaxID=158606 RepID=A0ACC1MUP5_9APHY|nr:hypothetical protein NUW54_g12670 [Trametes sanguinea]
MPMLEGERKECWEIIAQTGSGGDHAVAQSVCSSPLSSNGPLSCSQTRLSKRFDTPLSFEPLWTKDAPMAPEVVLTRHRNEAGTVSATNTSIKWRSPVCNPATSALTVGTLARTHGTAQVDAVRFLGLRSLNLDISPYKWPSPIRLIPPADYQLSLQVHLPPSAFDIFSSLTTLLRP